MIDKGIAYAEVFEILSYMNRERVMKIPVEIIELFKVERNKKYISKITPNDFLNPDNLSKDTINILAWLDLEYFCSEEQRKIKEERYKKNELEQEKIKRQIYNSDNLFKQKDKSKEYIEEAVVEYKKTNLLVRIFNKIKSLVKKNNIK